MRKLFVVLLGFFLVFSASSTTFAESVQQNTSNNITPAHLEIIQNTLNTPNPDGTPAQITNNESQDTISTQATLGTITPVFIRASDNSTQVYEYLTYAGNKAANAVKFSKMDIMNSSVLNRTVYKSFPAKTYNFGIASTYHNTYIGTANVPTNQTKVRVSDSGLMVYVTSSGWLSATNIIGQWPIQ